MSVYIDPPRSIVSQDPEARRAGRRWRHLWCHMMADTLDELHAIAAAIGLRREWFQGDHYDLLPSRRARALALGAIEVTTRDLVKLRQRNRRPGTASRSV